MRFKAGDLVAFRYNKKSAPPCVVINVNEKQGEWNKYYSYDVLIIEFGVVKDIRGGDIKKWKSDKKIERSE